MNNRFRFRIPITNKDGKFEKFVYFDLFNQPAITCRASDIFQNTEQCTGLKDKNGRLIYEGDIVKSDGELWKCVFEMNYGYGINSPGFVLKNKFGHAQPFRNMQVIGNIHENPELLEDK